MTTRLTVINPLITASLQLPSLLVMPPENPPKKEDLELYCPFVLSDTLGLLGLLKNGHPGCETSGQCFCLRGRA
jgi:hypothetical protein